MNSSIFIAHKPVGGANPCLLIAEVGLVHDGSLGNAHCFVDAVANAGANAVKFQTHIARYESTLEEPFRVPFSKQDEQRFDYWERTAFTEDQWAGLAEHARERGLAFLSSPFSVAAVGLLRRVGVDAWKIGSGEFFSDDLLTSLLDDDLPVLLSTGMATWNELEERVAFFAERNKPLALFQCTTHYPTSPADVGLNVLREMTAQFPCPVGLSDHSGKIYPALAAMSVGASLVETHVVFDKRMFGPDVAASLTIDEFARLSEGRDWFHKMRSNPVDKHSLDSNSEAMRGIFTKSVGYRDDLPEGTVLAEEHLVARKPAGGIPFSDRARLIGRRLARDVAWKHLLKEEDLEP